MQKKNIKLFVIIGSIILCCFFSTIAYSAIYATMEISGLAYARVVKDVRITDFKLNSSSTNTTSSYEEFGVNTISSKFNLLDSSSSIVFDVEVTNYGSSDVGILQLIGDVPTGLSYEIINYNLKDKICDDNGKCNQMAVKTFQIKFTGTPGEYEITQELDFRTYHKVTYTGITNNNYPTEVIDGGNLNITFTENLKKVSVLSDGTEISHYDQISGGQTITIENVSSDIEIKKNKELVARLVSGDIDEVGSEVCIKDECFYIIGNDGSKVTMLAKYNLFVGNSVDEAWNVTPLTNPTGIQDETAVGFNLDENLNAIFPYIGTTAFSDTSTMYTGSIVERYIDDYSNYLSSLGVTLIDSRMLNVEESCSLGCELSESPIGLEGHCRSAPSFVYSTSYWVMTGSSSGLGEYGIRNNGGFDSVNYGSDNYYGVRPVIEMSVDDIKLPEKPVMVSGDYDTVGSEVAIGDEHFYVISSTDTTVTMLSKYNLHVGNSVEFGVGLTALTNPTGIQDKTAAGSIPDEDSGRKYPVIGTVAFSNEYYWEGIDIYSYVEPVYVYNANSSVYTYVNNYKLYLETFGLVVDEARLIKYDELLGLGCSDWNCKNAPNWLYSTSYWTGEAWDDMGYLLVVYKCGESQHIIDFTYNNIDSAGVRPVITISKSEF